MHKPGKWLLTESDFLGDMIEEMANYGQSSYITEFVADGTKNYGYKHWSGNQQYYKSVFKVKDLSLH